LAIDDLYIYNIEHVNIREETTRRDILELLKEHDIESYDHSLSVAYINYAIAKEIGFVGEELKNSYESGLYHDVGKLGMSKEFIGYPGRYTDAMLSEMKNHPLGGAELLERVGNVDKSIIEAARNHHCNFDGTGYPGGIYEGEIPLTARITRVSDSAEAYMTNRVYKDGGQVKDVYKDIHSYEGKHYDPKIVDGFRKVHEKVMEKCKECGVTNPTRAGYMRRLKDEYISPLTKGQKDSTTYKKVRLVENSLVD